MEKCVEIKPNQYDYLERGCLKQDTGDLDGALQDFNKAISEDKSGFNKDSKDAAWLCKGGKRGYDGSDGGL